VCVCVDRSQRSFTSTSASEELDDEEDGDDRGCQITVTVEPVVRPRDGPKSDAENGNDVWNGARGGVGVGGGQLTLELTPPDECARPGGNRRRSITSPKLERQEAFAVNDAAAAAATMDPAAVRDLFLAVPDLKRDRAASMDSCFVNKPTPAGKPEEVVPVSPTQLLCPDAGQPAGNNLRSRSVDIVLPTDQQARYKALSTNNQTSSSSPPPPPSSAATHAHRVPPDKG